MENILQCMMAIWPEYKKYALSFLQTVGGRPVPKDVCEHYDKMLDYTVLGGKMLRGQLLVKTFWELQKFHPVEVSEEAKKYVMFYGWIIETLQASFLIADDISDCATLRRGKTCWHLLKGNEVVAINDSMHLYVICLKMAQDIVNKISCSNIYHDVLMKTINITSLGQNLDSSTKMVSLEDHYRECSLERVLMISENKTSQYTLTSPVECGTTLLTLMLNKNDSDGIKDEFYKEACELCKHIGVLFQMQDDYINIIEVSNYLEHRRQTGIDSPISKTKDACDISEGKATWIHHRLLFTHENKDELNAGQSPYDWKENKRNISDEELNIIITNYGVQNKFDLVYDIYMKYGIIEESLNDIKSYIKYIRNNLPKLSEGYKNILLWLLNLIDERKY